MAVEREESRYLTVMDIYADMNMNRQKYTRYLPVVEARAGSPARKKTGSKDSESRSSKETDAKNAALSISSKRRATMNSRAAYEEDEMLRRALEESKGGGGPESSNSGHRKSKRTRDDSDEYVQQLRPGWFWR